MDDSKSVEPVDFAAFSTSVSAVTQESIEKLQDAMKTLSEAVSTMADQVERADDVRYTLEHGGKVAVIDSVDFEIQVEEDLDWDE